MAGRVEVHRLSSRLVLIRAVDRETERFEALWEIPEGVTYNSYLLLGDEAVLVLDTVKEAFAEEYVEALRSLVEPGSVSGVVVHHSEPDHAGALPALLRLARNATVYAHPVARGIIESRYGVRLDRFKALGDGFRLGLGGGEHLEFISTPWLHWPDTLMSFYGGTLFSGDAFGAYGVSGPRGCPGGLGGYKRLLRKYYATVVGHYRGWTLRALEKLGARDWSLERIAPLHGMVLEGGCVGEALGLYESWGRGALDKGRAVVVYGSMYGAVEAMALEAAGLLKARGLEVAVYGFTDRGWPRLSDIVGDVFDAAYLVIGASTYEASAYPPILFLADLLCSKAAAGQRALILSSYGWGPAAARLLRERLGGCGFRVVASVEARGLSGDWRSRLGEAVEALLAA